jgi:hypothetical protein
MLIHGWRLFDVDAEPRLCRTLFLCYPDDFEKADASMAEQCLEHFSGSTVIHAGELFGDTIMLDKAPWGRTTGQTFQEHLFSTYRYDVAYWQFQAATPSVVL